MASSGAMQTAVPSASAASRWQPARWVLTTAIVVSTMVPWYTLRLLPVLTVGRAKVNVLDALVACAVLLAAPAVVRCLLRDPRRLVWPCAFLVYMMTIPLALGLRDHAAAFLAVRESRALAFYALALAFAAGPYAPEAFRGFCTAYVAGMLVAVAAMVVHLASHVPLPGYVDPGPSATIWAGLRYLEWTVCTVAFLLSLANALAARSRLARWAWAGASVPVAWYIFSTSERLLQALAFAIAIALPNLRWLGGCRSRRIATLGAVGAVAALVIAGSMAGAVWLHGPVHDTARRWSEVLSDNSVDFRIEEIARGVPRVARRPLFGEGLGGLVMHDDPTHQHLAWRYIADGYGYLLIKTGIVGLALYVGMVASALRAASRRARDWPAGRWPAAAIAVAGITALLVLNVFYPTVDTPEGAIAFSLFYGMSTARG